MQLRIAQIGSKNVWKGIFTTVSLGPHQVGASYYLTFVYSNLPVVVSRHPVVYGEGFLADSVKELLKWGMESTLRDDLSVPFAFSQLFSVLQVL